MYTAKVGIHKTYNYDILPPSGSVIYYPIFRGDDCRHFSKTRLIYFPFYGLCWWLSWPPDRSGLAGVLYIYTPCYGLWNRGWQPGSAVERSDTGSSFTPVCWSGMYFYLVGGKKASGRWIICQFRQPACNLFLLCFSEVQATPEQKSCPGHAGHILDGAGVPASEMGFTWPWLTLGNVFAGAHTWVQWYELTEVSLGNPLGMDHQYPDVGMVAETQQEKKRAMLW